MSRRGLFFVFWFFLSYIVAAVMWWFIVLERQSEEIFRAQTAHIDESSHAYRAAVHENNKRYWRNIGEGGVSLFVILMGAGLLYSLLRRTVYISRQESNFLLTINHELKTPLAAMQLYAQTLQRGGLSEDKRKEIIDSFLREIRRINQLYDNILTSSRMTRGKKNTHHFTEVDLPTFLRDIQQSWQKRFPEYTITFTDDTQGNANMYADEPLLRLLIDNLMDNALKYSCAGCEVQLYLRAHGRKRLYIHVADQGIGISTEDSKYIFHKFYRASDERTRRTAGSGLGLYLAKQISFFHRGKIQWKNNTPRGSIFSLVFPLHVPTKI